MLLQFNVSNVLSFKEEAILDLVANTDSTHEENLISFNKDKVFPTLAIYGANASGKSNLFKALTAAILFVRNSNNMQVNSKIRISPFSFNDTSKYDKQKLDFIFVHNNIKYEYGFTLDSNKVYEEYLYEYKSSKPSKIFERYDFNKYSYTNVLRHSLSQYEEKNTDNKLFLATATAWNCKETKNAFLWFSDSIDTYNSESIENSMVDELANESNSKREFFIKLLKKADFNISDFEFEYKETNPGNIQLPSGLTFDDNFPFQNVREWKLDMHHEVVIEGNKRTFKLPYHLESNGTQLYFSYAPAIFNALTTGKTLVIDEIDRGLHPLLVQSIVEIFNDKEINKNGAQLIFNTHDVNLLDLDLLRRDQIYFVEKDNLTACSELYSLSDFSPRKNDKIGKRYLQGRYGAIPNIGFVIS